MTVDPNVVSFSASAVRWTLVSSLLIGGGVFLFTQVPPKARRLVIAVALAVFVGGGVALHAQLSGPWPWLDCCPAWFPLFCIPPWLISC